MGLNGTWGFCIPLENWESLLSPPGISASLSCQEVVKIHNGGVSHWKRQFCVSKNAQRYLITVGVVQKLLYNLHLLPVSIERRALPYWSSYSRPRLAFHTITSSKYFDLAIAAVIGINVVTMAMEYHMMPEVPTLFAPLIRFKPEAFGELSLIPHRSYESSCYIFSFSVRRFLQYCDNSITRFMNPVFRYRAPITRVPGPGFKFRLSKYFSKYVSKTKMW